MYSAPTHRRARRAGSAPGHRRRLLLEPLEARHLLAGVPVVDLSPPTEQLIGENFTLTATFDNTAANPADVGYGPFVDLIFPVNGADGMAGMAAPDGISFVGATYLGSPVFAMVIPFPDDGGGIGAVAHPYAVDAMGMPLTVVGTAGDQLVVLQLPFGSFAPDQPPAVIAIEASLSNLADLGTPLTLSARAGFQFGCDPLNNPMSDPTLLTPGSDLPDSATWAETTTVTPALLRLTKTYLGPEDETATGPNFPRQYELTVDIAAGQTITDFDLSDALDNTMAFLSVDSTTSVTPATLFTFPGGLPPVGVPANMNTLTVNADTVTGGAGDTDLQVVFSFFIAEFDADGARVIPLNGQDPTITTDTAAGVGDWIPLDIRDPATPGNAVGGPVTHELQNKSIAIQKSFTVIGGGDPEPGITVEFTLEFQISDYYTFGELLLEDILSDGLDWLPSFAPTFDVSDQDGSASGMFATGTDLTHMVNPDGTETLVFDLSAAMIGAGAADGILRGGLATALDGDNSSPASAAVGTIVFRATVSQNYDQMPPSTRPPIAQGDTLANDVTISGTVRDNVNPAVTIGPAPDGREGDDSSASGQIPVGSVSKSIYAVNGVPVVGPPPLLAPGDEVTYSLEYTLPISTFVDFRLTDYFPLPVFRVTDPDADGVAGPAWSFVLDGNPSNSPAPGTIELGPNDTFFAVAGLSAGPDFYSPPQITPLPNANALELFYGDFDDPLNQFTTVNLLLTVTTTDTPFADALFLTNQVRGSENNSNLDQSIDDGIVQIQLGQPNLNITKGVLATDSPAGIFNPAPPAAAPLMVSPPGSAGFRLSGGTLNSDYLDATPLDSNLAGLDAGDLVTFAIVVENTGSSRRGAFDVALRDSLPAGFRIPTPAESPAGLNLSVTDGTGDPVPFNVLGGGLFDPLGGIELVDPGPTLPQMDGTDGGALDAYNATSGRNVLIVTLDLITDLSVTPRETLENTATLFHYAGAPGGPDHTAEDPTDEALVGLRSSAIEKRITATNQAHTMLTDVAIGEIVTYEVAITLPEGTSHNVRLVDQLDSGLAFVGINSITALPGVATSVMGGFAAVAANVSVANVGGGAVNQGRLVTLDFETVTNSNTNNNFAETIVVSYDVVVLNSTNNNRGNLRNNQADWRWDTSAGTEQIRDSAPNVRIVEPTLEVVKDAVPTQVEAGDTVLYTIDISHTTVSDADAFNVVLTDLIPPDTSFDIISLQNTGGLPPDLLQESGGIVTAIWNEFPVGSSSQLQFEVMVMPTAMAGSTITNTADMTWTSLPLDITTPQSLYNTLSTERTGNPADPGGAANDYRSSDPASVTVRLPTVLDKTLVSTSEPHTANSNVAIGEIVRYQLRGTLVGGTNPSIRIVDELPTGLVLLDLDQVKISFTSETPIVAAPDLLGANNGLVPPTFVLPAGRISVGPSVTFDLGTLINLDVDDNDEIVTIEFNALVLNSADNNDGDVKGNLFRAFTGPTLVGISPVVDVTVREPAIINVDKHVVGIPPSDAGDEVTYQVTFSNSGTATAFDVRLLDSLHPSLLDLTLPPMVTLANGATGATDNSSGNTLDIVIDQIPVGGMVTVLYTATLTQAVEPSQVIPNLATVTYSSLPGAGTPSTSPDNPTGSQAPGGSGAANGERDGSGGVNDYRDSDDANVFVVNPLFTKSLLATNQAFTTNHDVAIGEIVTYQAVITVPEGTMPDAQVFDAPDPGLAIIAVDSVVPNSPNVTTDVVGGFAQAAANASIPIDGSSVTIDLGTITNADSDLDAETLTITYRAVVLNTLANSRGVQLNNSAEFTWSLGSLSAQAANVTIVEPALQLIKLNGNPILGDAGDTITFELLVQHTPQSNANAFDVQLLDPIDSVLNKLNYVPGTVSVVNAGGAMLATQPDETGGDLSIVWSDFPLGASSTISFDVTLDISVGLNELLTNQAFLTWTSLPGDVTSPQSPNPYSVERTGDPLGPGEPGANDYASQDSGLVGTPTLTFAKEVLDSSELSTLAGQFDTSLTDLTIGETVTYGLIVGLPDGTFPNVVVTDNLPSLSSSEGVLEFVSASLVFVGADITDGNGDPLLLPLPVLTDTNTDGIADRVEFNLGTVINTPDANGISEADQFVVAVVARVLNTLPDMTPVNFSGDTLTNRATVDAPGLPVPFEDSVDVEIVEPLLTITKDASTTLVDGGDTVTFTMTVTHAPTSTATAFDVAISDILPAGMTYASNVTVLSGSGPLVTVSGPLLTFSWPDIPLGAVAHQFTFDVTVDPSVTPGQTFLNVGDLAWSTLPGTDPGERTYMDSDPADLITSTTTARNPIKTLVATSEAHTAGSDVAIGEIVRYRLQFEVTEGTLPNLRMIDTLDPGLQLVDPTQVFISFTSGVPMGAAIDLLGANNGDQPPTHLVSGGRIMLLGQQVIFDLGTITNNDNDLNAELITLEYNVLVQNTSDTNDGDVLSNSFTVDLDGTPIGPANPGDNTVSVTVLEPLIDDVQKSVLTLADGSVTYEVTFSNTGTTTAFDTRLLDMLPPQLALNVASVSVTLLGGASNVDAGSSTPAVLDVRIAQMPVGSQAIIAYTASVLTSGQTISNTASVTCTSLPGTNGTPDNPTGSQTPGVPGAANGERTGDGGVNDYLDSDSESLGSLGDRVWDDLNGNGVQDGGEPGLDGVTVTLTWPGRNGILGDGDDVTLSAITAGGGLYIFSGLPAGNYDVSVDPGTLPPGYVNTFDLDGNRNSQTNAALAAGQNRTDVDFGYSQSASAGGIKWNDTNGNGVQDGGEGPLAGVTVFVDLNGNRVFEPGEPSDVTDASGAYQIDGLLPGTYTIREVPPVGYRQTFPTGFAGHTVTLAPDEALGDLHFGNQPIPVLVINDFDDEFQMIQGPWDRFDVCVGHWNDDATTAPPGSGELLAQWVFTSLEPGFYRVSATWLENPTGATNTPYTILGGPTSETVRVNQILSPADYPNSFDYGNQPWMDLDASYQILGDTLIVQISNDADGLVIADAIRIEQIVNPEIAVSQGATELTDGASVVDYGQTSTGAPVTLTYTVENLGGFDLDLAEPIQVPAGFSVVSTFGSTTLAPAQMTTFSVRLDAAQPGVYGGDIVFYSSDSDENPFSFRVSGLVDAQIVDDGDVDFSTVGAWTPYVGAGYQNDNTFSSAGSGGDLATWSFDDLTDGATYQVAATWVPHGNRASNAPYTVTGGAAPIVRAINQRLAPDDLLEAGTAWEILGNVVLTGTTLQVQLSDAANGFVSADAIRVVPIVGPEIGVEVDAGSVLSNVTTVDFGVTLLNLPVQKTFTVTNSGTQPLTLVEPIAAPTGFLVSGFGQSVLNPNQSTTFTVTMPATTTGSFSGLVSFGTNDADENPFQFTVSGQVYVTPPPQIVDDGDSDFSTVGFWSFYPGIGHEGDVRFADPGSGATTATWSFTLPAPGIYRVSVTWAEHPNRATNAPYSVNGGPATLVNQQLAPSDFIEGGTPWRDLGNFVIAGNTLDLTLTNAANGYVIADAVRIERIASPEIRVTADGHLIHNDTGVLDLGTLVQGELTARQVRVRNIGTEYLVLDFPSASSGWSVSQFGQYVLAPEQWTTFTVSRDTSAPGSFSGQVWFANNDPDEGLFQFAVVAEVAAAPQVSILDDGDAGFQLTGNWTAYAGLGYQQDLRYSAGGTGSDTARWTFTRLTPGGYRVAATWAPHSNRGSNVPYAVGGAPPVLVNQRLAPDDFSDQGAAWELLGDFLSAGDQLVVTTSDAANGYVVADAVRIERILDAEIQVTESGQLVRDGLATLAFGSTPVGAPVAKTFTITNLGAQTLDLTAPVQVPPGFTATAFGQSSLHAGESTTFTITLTAASGGSYSGTASFTNNDADEGLFDFGLTGTVGAPPPPPQLVDDGQTGFSVTSGWTRYTGVGYEGDVQYTTAGNGSRVATWAFTVPAAGDYLVSTTWVPHPNRATDAPYRLYDGTVSPANLRTTTRVNQEVAPIADFVVGGIAFQDLGVVTVSGSTLTVTLANDANQYVIADAIRIEFVQPLRAAVDERSAMHVDTTLLEPSEVRRLLPAAAAHWTAEGHARAVPGLLDGVNFKLVDLPGNMLGGQTSAGLLIDRDAAGWGWSVAGGDFDLLTVLAHELGHVLGYADLEYDARLESQPLMVGYLAAGERRIDPTLAGQPMCADWPGAGGVSRADDRGSSRHDQALAWFLDRRADDHPAEWTTLRLERSPRGPAPRDVPAPRTGIGGRMELVGVARQRRELDRSNRSDARLESDLELRPEPVDEVLRDWFGT